MLELASSPLETIVDNVRLLRDLSTVIEESSSGNVSLNLWDGGNGQRRAKDGDAATAVTRRRHRRTATTHLFDPERHVEDDMIWRCEGRKVSKV